MERTNSNGVGSHQLACHHTFISKLLTSVERRNPLMGYSTHFGGELSEFDIWLHKILKIMPDIRNVSFFTANFQYVNWNISTPTTRFQLKGIKFNVPSDHYEFPFGWLFFISVASKIDRILNSLIGIRMISSFI